MIAQDHSPKPRSNDLTLDEAWLKLQLGEEIRAWFSEPASKRPRLKQDSAFSPVQDDWPRDLIEHLLAMTFDSKRLLFTRAEVIKIFEMQFAKITTPATDLPPITEAQP